MDEGEEDAQGFDGDEDCYSIDSSDDSGDDYLAENEDVDTLRDVMRKKTRLYYSLTFICKYFQGLDLSACHRSSPAVCERAFDHIHLCKGEAAMQVAGCRDRQG